MRNCRLGSLGSLRELASVPQCCLVSCALSRSRVRRDYYRTHGFPKRPCHGSLRPLGHLWCPSHLLGSLLARMLTALLQMLRTHQSVCAQYGPATRRGGLQLGTTKHVTYLPPPQPLALPASNLLAHTVANTRLRCEPTMRRVLLSQCPHAHTHAMMRQTEDTTINPSPTHGWPEDSLL